MIKLVTASNGSFAAGNDINITVNVSSSATNADVFRALLDVAGVTHDSRGAGSFGGDDRSTEEKISNVLMIASTSAFSSPDSYSGYFRELADLKALVEAGMESMRQRKYVAAHEFFGRALELDGGSAIRGQLVFDYFVSGYVGFSLLSDVQSIRALISQVQQRFDNIAGRSLNILIVEAHQEVATRQIGDEMLRENDALVDALIARYGNDVRTINLQGLLYRRFGERKSMGDKRLNYLTQSATVFEKLSAMMGETMPIEAKNNWAIALVRRFELTHDESLLDQAEAILDTVDFLGDAPVSLPDFLALPKALNNLGNVKKQRLALSRSLHGYTEALENYGRTERFWDEAGSPYEWAMIQKNKADVRCVFLEVFGFNRDVAETALKEIENSLKYRSAEKAPYQFRRSMDVKERLLTLLSQA